MLFDTKKIINICAKRKINPNQLLYLYSIYTKDWAGIYKLVNEVKYIESKLELEDLVNKGYLINWSGEWVNQSVDNFEVTDKFKHLLFIDTEEAGEELYKEYPKFIVIDNKSIPATQGGEYKGRYLGKDEVMELYSKKISNNYEQHQENLIGIRKAIKNNVQLPVLRKYVIDEMWLSFNELSTDSKIAAELNDLI